MDTSHRRLVRGTGRISDQTSCRTPIKAHFGRGHARAFCPVAFSNFTSSRDYELGVSHYNGLWMWTKTETVTHVGILKWNRNTQRRRNRGFRRFNEPGLPSSWGPRVVGPQKNFRQDSFKKIIKIVVTRWRILRLKCTKFDFGWSYRPRWGSLQTPRPPSWIWGPLRGRGG